MIIEYLRYEIGEERRTAFVAAYADAAVELSASPHCLRFEVAECTEARGIFLVRLEWDSLEGHLQGFRKEPAFRSFFAKVQPFFEQLREMRHYELTDVVSR